MVKGAVPIACNHLSLVALLKASDTQTNLNRLHANVLKHGLLKQNIFIGNTLINMYAKFGALAKAQELFYELPFQTVVSWTALITGYAENGKGEDALKCFKLMKSVGHFPDAITLASILKACGSLRSAEEGKEIHAEIVREGLLGTAVKLGSALVDMYAKCGALAKAQEVFDDLPVQNVVSWTALITGYCQHEHGDEALYCFERMKGAGLSPDAMTFASLLKACGSLGAIEIGEALHAEVARMELVGEDTVLVSALVDMYAKCGTLGKAQEVFDKLLFRDVRAWTALITGYDHVGKHHVVLDLFMEMIGENIEPNVVTYINVLNACCYLGLVDEGQSHFKAMSTKYCVIPTLEHYTCMVGLYGRAGHFGKAMSMIKKMPSLKFLPAWLALLGACQKWGKVKIGRLAFEHALRLNEKSAVAYVCMNKIYAAAGMQEAADQVEAMRLRNEAW